ncbi:MAG TPA: hypothetical protein VK348_14205 [Planctomycetota bacterium]|nr:hypothetical protein [Planctomycetota bacterium]
MASKILAFAPCILLAACQIPNPVLVTPSFHATPALVARNPADIAVLPVEDGTPNRAVARLGETMRQALMLKLTERMYSPLSSRAVDAALSNETVRAGETVLTPAFLKRIAGKASDDATLAVRIDRWDESSLMTDLRVRFQIQAALAGATDGEVLWSGTLVGEVKAGGAGAAPLDKEAMARSCAELAMGELLIHLQPRNP